MINVSIIIPTFNMGEFLEECLESIVSQTLEDIEIICIDTGSTDNTFDIVCAYSARYSFIRGIVLKGVNVGDARNYGIVNTSGKYVFFLDADDVLFCDDALEMLFNAAEENDVFIAGGSSIRNMENELKRYESTQSYGMEFRDTGVDEYKNWQYYMGFWRFLYNRRFLLENNILFPSYCRGEDPVFMVKAFDKAERFWKTDKIVHIYRFVDKKINYTRVSVLNLVQCVRDILKICDGKNYSQLISNMIAMINQIWSYILLYSKKNDKEFVDLYEEIDDLLLRNDKKRRMRLCKKALFSATTKYEVKIAGYLDEMRKYKQIIIYGASYVGTSVYDLIKDDKTIQFGGFAVSNIQSDSFARGIQIKSLDDYVNKADDALVVIAVENESVKNKMKDFAYDRGFRFFLWINEFNLLDISRV